jgi:P pilus assembly chaperone PapD
MIQSIHQEDDNNNNKMIGRDWGSVGMLLLLMLLWQPFVNKHGGRQLWRRRRRTWHDSRRASLDSANKTQQDYLANSSHRHHSDNKSSSNDNK